MKLSSADTLPPADAVALRSTGDWPRELGGERPGVFSFAGWRLGHIFGLVEKGERLAKE